MYVIFDMERIDHRRLTFQTSKPTIQSPESRGVLNEPHRSNKMQTKQESADCIPNRGPLTLTTLRSTNQWTEERKMHMCLEQKHSLHTKKAQESCTNNRLDLSWPKQRHYIYLYAIKTKIYKHFIRLKPKFINLTVKIITNRLVYTIT